MLPRAQNGLQAASLRMSLANCLGGDPTPPWWQKPELIIYEASRLRYVPKTRYLSGRTAVAVAASCTDSLTHGTARVFPTRTEVEGRDLKVAKVDAAPVLILLEALCAADIRQGLLAGLGTSLRRCVASYLSDRLSGTGR